MGLFRGSIFLDPPRGLGISLGFRVKGILNPKP